MVSFYHRAALGQFALLYALSVVIRSRCFVFS